MLVLVVAVVVLGVTDLASSSAAAQSAASQFSYDKGANVALDEGPFLTGTGAKVHIEILIDGDVIADLVATDEHPSGSKTNNDGYQPQTSKPETNS